VAGGEQVVAAVKFIELRRRAHPRWGAAFVVGTAGVVGAVGIVGLVRDSWPSRISEPWINMHAVFGLLLWIMVVAQFQQRTRAPDLMQEANIDSSCRQLSRAVYLLLYLVFGADLIIRAMLHPSIAQPPENLRDYLAYGVLALLTLRAMAARHRRTLRRAALCSTFADDQYHE
jgi:cytochrome b561